MGLPARTAAPHRPLAPTTPPLAAVLAGNPMRRSWCHGVDHGKPQILPVRSEVCDDHAGLPPTGAHAQRTRARDVGGWGVQLKVDVFFCWLAGYAWFYAYVVMLMFPCGIPMAWGNILGYCQRIF